MNSKKNSVISIDQILISSSLPLFSEAPHILSCATKICLLMTCLNFIFKWLNESLTPPIPCAVVLRVLYMNQSGQTKIIECGPGRADYIICLGFNSVSIVSNCKKNSNIEINTLKFHWEKMKFPDKDKMMLLVSYLCVTVTWYATMEQMPVLFQETSLLNLLYDKIMSTGNIVWIFGEGFAPQNILFPKRIAVLNFVIHSSIPIHTQF